MTITAISTNAFQLRDSELGEATKSYFIFGIGDSKPGGAKYIKPDNSRGNSTAEIGYKIYEIGNREQSLIIK